MKGIPSASVLIFPGTFETPLLNDVIQAMRHVESIMALNDDEAIMPGDVCGMSLMLRNAEKALADMRSALPAMGRRHRPPACSNTAWLDTEHAAALTR